MRWHPYGDKDAGPWHAARRTAPKSISTRGADHKSIHADLPGFLLRRMLMYGSTMTV